MDKLKKSLENIVDVLYTSTQQMKKMKDYEEIDIMMSTVNNLTTNAKRLFDMGVIYGEEQLIDNVDKEIEEGENLDGEN